MTCSIARVTAVIVMVAVSAMVAWSAEEQQIDKIASGIQLEPADQGETLSYWLRSIRDRDDNILLAMDAIRDLGQDAWPAVEELTRIVAEPFTPVRIGVDRDDVIARKLLSIHLRGDAIDALTAIGETASASAGRTDAMGADCASHSDESGNFIRMALLSPGILKQIGREVCLDKKSSVVATVDPYVMTLLEKIHDCAVSAQYRYRGRSLRSAFQSQ